MAYLRPSSRVARVMIEGDDLSASILPQYTHLIVVTGASSWFDETMSQAVKSWVQQGGILIGIRGGASYATSRILNEEMKKAPSTPITNPLRYADYDSIRALDRIGGRFSRSN